MKSLGCWLLFCTGLLAFTTPPQPLKQIFDQAAQALAAADYPTAERGFQTVLRSEPNNVGAIGNLGIIYSRTNRADQAITAYKHALRLSPNDEAILLNLGLVYLKQEQHDLALPFFTRVVAIDAHHQQARQLLAVCRLYTGQVAQAIRDLDELKSANPADEQILFLLGFAHLKNGDTEIAKFIFDEMFQVVGPVRAQFLLGRASYEAALFPQAEDSFLDVRKQDPNFPGLHLALGKLYISERRIDDAVGELKLGLQENPNSEEANYFLGALLVQETRYAEGISYLQEAKKLRPDSWATYFYLGKAQLRTGKSAEAVTLLQRAVALNPGESSPQYQLGRALQADGQKAAADQAFQRARELKADALSDTKIPGVR